MVDIGSEDTFPSGNLSNFHPHLFVFRGVMCNSMEGLLQSLKFANPEMQIEVCMLVGREAKFRGKKRNKAWKMEQTLWWQGEAIDRHGEIFQKLLDEAFDELATNESFRKALLVTRGSLTHSIGKTDPHDTVLTVAEFCSRLEKIRDVFLGQE